MASVALSNAAKEDKKVSKLQAFVVDFNSICVSVDNGIFGGNRKNARVDIIFERKVNGNIFKAVDWCAKVDWSKWTNSNGSAAMIKVSELQFYDKMTIVIMRDDVVLSSKVFSRQEIATGPVVSN